MAAESEGIFVGGGEMGALMRATDWSDSPLGPPDTWPVGLRAALNLLLESPLPSYIGWGPEFIQFYNDAYRPILGADKHPGALGHLARETFEEIWPTMSQIVEIVMSGQSFQAKDSSLPLVRRGYLEECYFTFSFSPIRDSAGNVGGGLALVTETTDYVLRERRLITLRDMAFQGQQNAPVSEVLQSRLQVLHGNAADMPLILFYKIEGLQANRLEIADQPVPDRIPDSIQLSDPQSVIYEAVQSRQLAIIEQADRYFGSFAAPPWPEPIEKAVALPVFQSGDSDLFGVLVIGLSPRLTLDNDYQNFLALVSGQLSTAISYAQAYAAERHRVQVLADLDRDKIAFFRRISHEFRTPLTLMINPLSELLDQKIDLSKSQRETLHTAHTNSLRLLKLVNTLLDFSQIQSSRIQAAFEPTDLATLTSNLAGTFESLMTGAGLTFVIDCPPLSEPLFIDQDMWEKIVLNLLSNAFKFTFEGEIAITLREEDHRVILTVRDSGVGIAADDILHLADQFYRISGVRARTHEGSGIGLALVKELVQLHGGTFTITSTPDVGSAFAVSLPFGAAHLPPDQIKMAHRRVIPSETSHVYAKEALHWLPDDQIVSAEPLSVSAGMLPAAGALILVTDDNANMRQYLKHLLEPRYRVLTAADTSATLDLIQERRPDLLITDILMPGINGFDLIRQLRDDPNTRLLPIIVLSARAGEEARVEGLRAGANDYMVKPFSARELVARVDSQLTIARLRQQLLDTERSGRIRAEESDRIKMQFLAMISHELKTPLTSIKGFSSTLLASDVHWNAEMQQQFIGIIDTEADKLMHLIGDLLDVSHLQAGRLRIQPRVQSLINIVDAARIELAVLSRAHWLTINVSPDLPYIYADSVRLTQVLTNLVSNACKYSPPKTHIVIEAQPVDHFVHIHVSDEGVGIPPELYEAIFEPFQQGINGKQGVGLGLAICKGLIEMHGGRIWVAEKNPPGTRISFSVPTVAEAAD